MDKVIVFVDHINANGQSGSVVPIGYIESDGACNIIAEPAKEFPTRGSIFVSKDFSHITDTFEDGELFVLNRINRDENSDNIDICWAYGSNAEQLGPKFFCPIIEIASKIDPSKPAVDINLDFIGQRLFFVRYDNDVYGPFVTMQNDDKWILKAPDVSPCHRLMSMHIWKISFKLLYDKGLIFHSDSNQTAHEIYVTNVDSIAGFDPEMIDYIDDKRLINWANANVFSKSEKSFTKKELATIRENVEKTKNIKEMLKTPRLQRVLSLIETHGDFDSERRLFLDLFFKSPKSDEIKEKYLESKKPELVAELRDRLIAEASKGIEDIEKQRKRLESEILTLKDHKSNLDSDISERESQIEIHRRQFEEKMLFDMKTKKEELNRLENEIIEKKNCLDELSAYESINKEIKGLEVLKQRLQKQNENLEKRKDDLIEEMVLELEVQKRAKVKPNETFAKLESKYISNELDHSLAYQGQMIFENIFDPYWNQWLRFGREMSKSDFIHLLIAIHINILTIFTGDPGSGKTSLARLIYRALGLPNSHYKQISVGRGWVSEKDLLGYFNPINGEWVESESGLNRFIVNISKSSRDKSPMGLVVLDEANLSPLEHYWSKFIGYCDDVSVDMDFNGHVVQFGLDEPFRFVCTINSDHTTEKISPRVIDRSAVFELKSKGAASIAFDELNNCDSCQWIEIKKVLSFLNERFSKFGDDETVHFEEVFSDILQAFSEKTGSGLPIILSNRKINKIKKHFYLASLLCKSETKDIVDMISIMYILPHINGYGGPFKKRLESIRNKFAEKKCPKSEAKIVDIISRGDTIGGFYSFL